MPRQKMQCLIGYKVIVLAVNVLISFPVKSSLNIFFYSNYERGTKCWRKKQEPDFRDAQSGILIEFSVFKVASERPLFSTIVKLLCPLTDTT